MNTTSSFYRSSKHHSTTFYGNLLPVKEEQPVQSEDEPDTCLKPDETAGLSGKNPWDPPKLIPLIQANLIQANPVNPFTWDDRSKPSNVEKYLYPVSSPRVDGFGNHC